MPGTERPAEERTSALTDISHHRYPLVAVHAFDVLGDPVRRRILELLVGGERPAGEIGSVVGAEFGISQPAVSLHLRVLRESGFATVRASGARRLYAVDPAPFRDIDTWLDPYRQLPSRELGATDVQMAKGKRERRLASEQVARPTKKQRKRAKRKEGRR